MPKLRKNSNEKPLKTLRIFCEGEQTGLVTVWFRSLVFHYATLASKAKGLMPPRYE